MTPPENQIYIRPTLHIRPNLAATKEFTDTYGAHHYSAPRKCRLDEPLTRITKDMPTFRHRA